MMVRQYAGSSFCGLTLGMAFSLIATAVIQADDQQEAKKKLRAAGARVRESQQELEVDFHLKGRNAARALLPLLARLDNVVWLNLANTNVTDAGLKNLSQLKQLRILHLEKTEIGDEGIQHLKNLEKLEYLNLYSTKITDESIDVLAQLPELRKLYVWQTNTTEEKVRQLAKTCPELQIARGIDLSQLPAEFPAEAKEPKPGISLKWQPIERREEAPVHSDNGVNCQVWFENSSPDNVKLYWISYGAGELKFYATLKPGEVRKQNSYSRNAWLITDEADRPLGYFIAKDDDSRAIIPKS